MFFSRSLTAALFLSSASAISSGSHPTATLSADVSSSTESPSNDFQIASPPKCLDSCSQSSFQFLKTVPLCGIPDLDKLEKDTDEAVNAAAQNSYSCLCTDKTYLRTLVGCSVKSCDDKDIAAIMTMLYELCNAVGSTNFPTPERFIAALGIDMGGKSIPKSLSLDNGGTTYVTNSVFPAVTATVAIGPSNSLWPTDPAVLKTATDTADDGEVRFTGTGTQIVTAAVQTTTAAGGSSSGAAAASASASAEPGKNAGGKVVVAGSVIAVAMGALLMVL
ncbi:hypothetical protein FPQ18DRAFT_404019 [Pyronema domesticum]|nr:hypothetical protein FPQ18DRAFT_404019 [Pyronema domesticum]